MNARLRSPFSPHRLAILLSAVLQIFALPACDGVSPAQTTPDDSPAGGVEWRSGSGQGGIAHDQDREVARCWKIQGRYDCLVARSTGLNEDLPGAPRRLLFFRFRGRDLPATYDALDKLATSDGYACELAILPGREIVTETYWTGGRIAHQQAFDRGVATYWSSAQIAALDPAGGDRVTRPLFSCPRVIDPVLDVGLFALDSGLVSYDAVISAMEQPAPPPAGDTGPADGQDR